jgi:hypothetical protein
MRPLKVAVIVKNKPAALERENKAMGIFSYPVNHLFTWDYVPLSKHFRLDTREYANKGYDLIFHIDGPLLGEYIGREIPTVFYAIDSTLSHENHYLPRLDMARKSRMVLVDHDALERFASAGRGKIFRFSHCVNDKVFRDYGLDKDCEVAFHCNSGHAAPSQERSDLRRQLHDICAANNWRYRSGMLPLVEYAQSMNAAKVTVNWPRNPANRPHRVLDAMACRTCLLTGPLPDVSDEFRCAGEHYLEFWNNIALAVRLDRLLMYTDEAWREIADAGYEMVMKHHTWAVRARQLRELLHVELGL